MTIDYDADVLRLRESTGAARTVRCEGYIGLSLCGFWDEAIVDHAEVVSRHPMIDRTVSDIASRLGQERADSGND